ncbi:MAG: hypothetical protein H6541_00015 [Lentimicrobiaceae bacterium]|nr:hypothetical protein [Lentimicrobiaceae bacterium]
MKTLPPTLPVNPVEIVAREIERQDIRPGKFAAKINRHPSSITTMMKRKDMSVRKLIVCCKALKYNFFQEIAWMLPYKGPDNPHIQTNPLSFEVDKLQKEIESLKSTIKANEKKISELKNEVHEADINRRMLETELNTTKLIMKDLIAAKKL